MLAGRVENTVYAQEKPLRELSCREYASGAAIDMSSPATVHSVRCLSKSSAEDAPAAVTLHVFVGNHADAVQFGADSSPQPVSLGAMYGDAAAESPFSPVSPSPLHMH